VITLRASGLWHVVPGEIVVVTPRKQWSYAGHPYLSGEIASTRLDVAALGLVPLRLEDRDIWDPAEEYWGEEGEPIEDWAKPIIAHGPRQEFEMEQVLPGADPDDPDSDPVTESNELKDSGDPRKALKILMKLCDADLRCLDAHSHLGNFVFDYRPAEAIRHYEVGLRIGELSLSADFDGTLPWGHVDNRPFLRCMHGFGLCCWRLGPATASLFSRNSNKSASDPPARGPRTVPTRRSHFRRLSFDVPNRIARSAQGNLAIELPAPATSEQPHLRPSGRSLRRQPFVQTPIHRSVRVCIRQVTMLRTQE
jgi:hypothetical protein